VRALLTFLFVLLLCKTGSSQTASAQESCDPSPLSEKRIAEILNQKFSQSQALMKDSSLPAPFRDTIGNSVKQSKMALTDIGTLRANMCERVAAQNLRAAVTPMPEVKCDANLKALIASHQKTVDGLRALSAKVGEFKGKLVPVYNYYIGGAANKYNELIPSDENQKQKRATAVNEMAQAWDTEKSSAPLIKTEGIDFFDRKIIELNKAANDIQSQLDQLNLNISKLDCPSS
jgi:hypothetical protein